MNDIYGIWIYTRLFNNENTVNMYTKDKVLKHVYTLPVLIN